MTYFIWTVVRAAEATPSGFSWTNVFVVEELVEKKNKVKVLATLILFRMYEGDTAAKHKHRLEGFDKKKGQGRFCVEVVKEG